MPARKKTVVLTSEAEADINDTLLYTWQRWGELQRDLYDAALEQALASLVDFPEMGRRFPRLFPGCRIRPVEHHLLYYRIMDDVIEVVRILHERTDPTRHFQP